MIEDFLGKLGASTRITVGVSVSPNVGLEMIEIDRLTGTINKYANKPLNYNQSTREIADYDEFRDALEELFEELHIPKNSNVVLSLPNVHFGIISLTLLLTDEAITNVIISEVEQSYIFKRHEPVVSWVEISSNIDTENRTFAYTAVQKESITQITEICSSIGCKLVGIESSYISLLRALHYSNLAKEQMQDNTTWNLMIIGQNSYSIISMLNKKIIEYYEEPLALKSFVDDEIYNAITTSAQLTLAGLPANHLYIISETDLVSSEVLSMKIPTESTVRFLECNKYTQTEIIPVNLNILLKTAMQITLESIGIATYPFHDFPLKMNLLNQGDESFGLEGEGEEYPRVNLGNLEIELTPSFVERIALIIGGIILIPMIIIFFILGHIVTPKEQTKLDAINSKITKANEEIAQYSGNGSGTFDIQTFTDGIVDQNEAKLSYYSSLGISVPNNLWVTYYVSNPGNKVDIKGKATSVEDVYTFYKNVKQTVNNSDIRLYKLEIGSESIEDVIESDSISKIYDFEITNMSTEELTPATPGATTPGAPSSGTPAPAAAPSSSPNPGPAPAPNNSIGSKIFGGDNKQLPPNLQKIENIGGN